MVQGLLAGQSPVTITGAKQPKLIIYCIYRLSMTHVLYYVWDTQWYVLLLWSPNSPKYLAKLLREPKARVLPTSAECIHGESGHQIRNCSHQNTSSVTRMIQHLQWPSLEMRRIDTTWHYSTNWGMDWQDWAPSSPYLQKTVSAIGRAHPSSPLCPCSPVQKTRLPHFDGLVQERCNSSALAMELCLSCTNPSISCFQTV